ncbi:MAG TPA: hypothetical protein VJS65_15625 [Verrucomicrobiae bacterium]|nr:hypothetical protein [Verrucomicrobiae bacterium]
MKVTFVILVAVGFLAACARDGASSRDQTQNGATTVSNAVTDGATGSKTPGTGSGSPSTGPGSPKH